MMLSGDLEIIEQMEINNSLMYCRVDFINSLLGTEIMDVIERWNQARDIPSVHSNLVTFLKKRKKNIADFLRYSLPFFIFILIISSINYFARQFFNSTISNDLQAIMYWIAISTVSFFVFKSLGFYIAKKVFNSIKDYGEFTTFRITTGDNIKQRKLDKINASYKNNILGGIIFSVILNITCGLIAAYLYDLL